MLDLIAVYLTVREVSERMHTGIKRLSRNSFDLADQQLG
jgi:hypothetical protein